jgi:hypothetical protein
MYRVRFTIVGFSVPGGRGAPLQEKEAVPWAFCDATPLVSAGGRVLLLAKSVPPRGIFGAAVREENHSPRAGHHEGPFRRSSFVGDDRYLTRNLSVALAIAI